jgi:hypothetical protein
MGQVQDFVGLFRTVNKPQSSSLLVLPVVTIMTAPAAILHVSMSAAIVRPAIPVGVAGTVINGPRRIVNLLRVAGIIRIVTSAAVAIARPVIISVTIRLRVAVAAIAERDRNSLCFRRWHPHKP